MCGAKSFQEMSGAFGTKQQQPAGGTVAAVSLLQIAPTRFPLVKNHHIIVSCSAAER